jgi:hypothetical protein
MRSVVAKDLEKIKSFREKSKVLEKIKSFRENQKF